MKAIGAEVDQLLKQVVYLANTKEQGRYLLVGIAQENHHLRRMVHTGGEKDVMWKLNDGYEIKAFRKGDDLLTPAIQTLVKMNDALQSGDQKALQPF